MQLKWIAWTWIGLGLLIGSAGAVSADPIVIDFDTATLVQLADAPYSEDGVTFTVLAGHYDIVDSEGSRAFKIDDDCCGPEPLVRIALDSGRPFNLLSFDITIFTEFNFVTSDLGDLFIPTSVGQVSFVGTFTGIRELFLQQTVPPPSPLQPTQFWYR